MAEIYQKLIEYKGYDLDGGGGGEWLKYVGNGINICGRAPISSKRLKYVGNGLDMRKAA